MKEEGMPVGAIGTKLVFNRLWEVLPLQREFDSILVSSTKLNCSCLA